MKINLRGVTRIVLLTKNYAFKIPRLNYGQRFFLRGLLANSIEAECHIRSERYCPVLFALPLGLLTVMPKLRIMTDKEFSIQVLHLETIPEFKIGDLKAENLGWYNGQIVLVDFGD